jgi:hypothetical protein
MRDPRDAALSIAKMSGSSYQEALENWKIFDDHNRAFIERSDSESVHALKYEDLVQDSYGAAERIFGLLGLKQDQQVVRFLDEYGSVDAHAIRNHDGLNSLTTENINLRAATHKLERWRDSLTQEDQDFTDHLISEALVEYGYPLCSEA